MKDGLIDIRFLFDSSSFARFAAPSVVFVPMAASIVGLLQPQSQRSDCKYFETAWKHSRLELPETRMAIAPRTNLADRLGWTTNRGGVSMTCFASLNRTAETRTGPPDVPTYSAWYASATSSAHFDSNDAIPRRSSGGASGSCGGPSTALRTAALNLWSAP